MLTELSAWCAFRPADQTAIAADIDRVGWISALEGIEQCIQAFKINRAEQLIALAKVIATKAVNLVGGEYLKTAVEILEALENIERVADIEIADIQATVNVLKKVEVFLISTLLAGQYGVVRVSALTGAVGESTLNEDLDSISQEARQRAKEVVIDHVHKAREAIAAVAGPEMGEITFPPDGFWPTSVQ